MKKMLVLSLHLAFFTNSFGQTTTTTPNIRPDQVAYKNIAANTPLRDNKLPDVSGSPYLSNEYYLGNVRTKNGLSENNIPIRFNIYDNTLEFKRGAIEQAVDLLDMAFYFERPGDSSSIRVLKAGYPGIDKQSPSTIYQVLYMGNNVQFLKYIFQKVEAVSNMGEQKKYELNTFSNYYIYTPSKGMTRIKAGKENIKELFPEKSKEIDDYSKKMKLNLKKESDLIQLLSYLNASA